MAFTVFYILNKNTILPSVEQRVNKNRRNFKIILLEQEKMFKSDEQLGQNGKKNISYQFKDIQIVYLGTRSS
jgi:hypothetical protein